MMCGIQQKLAPSGVIGSGSTSLALSRVYTGNCSLGTVSISQPCCSAMEVRPSARAGRSCACDRAHPAGVPWNCRRSTGSTARAGSRRERYDRAGVERAAVDHREAAHGEPPALVRAPVLVVVVAEVEGARAVLQVVELEHPP